jgi:hypothetical protein
MPAGLSNTAIIGPTAKTLPGRVQIAFKHHSLRIRPDSPRRELVRLLCGSRTYREALVSRTAQLAAAILVHVGVLSTTGLAAVQPLPHRNPLQQITFTQASPSTTAPDSKTSLAKSILGIEVRTTAEGNVGRIVDVLADRTGAIEAAVVELGGFLGIGTRKIAIDWAAFDLEHRGDQLVATLTIPRDRLRTAPEYKTGRPVEITRGD